MENKESYIWVAFNSLNTGKAAGVILVKGNDPEVATRRIVELKILPEGLIIGGIYEIDDAEIEVDIYHTPESLKEREYKSTSEKQ